MKLKLLLSLLVAGSLTAGAQSQGYIDGIEYYKAGQFTNAKTILDRTLNDANTDKALAYYYLGQIELQKDNKAGAKADFEKGVAANAENPYNYVGLGALALEDGNKSVAEDNFKTALKLAKKDKNHEVTVDIARAYYRADPVQYASEVQKYIDKASKESKFSEPSIFILQGDMLYDQKQYGDAAAAYEQAITADNTDPSGYVNYAQAYFNVNPEFSINKLKEFLQVAPNSALGQRELAEKYYDANYWTEAAEQYGQYMNNPNHFPEDEARYSVLLYFGKEYAKSLQVAEDLLKKDPGNFMVQRLVMLNHHAMADYPNAVKAGEAFFAKNPDGNFRANDYIVYAQALQQTGADSLAADLLNKGVAKISDDGNLLKEYSNVLNRTNRYQEAADVFAKFLSMQKDPEVLDLYDGAGNYLNVAATELETNPEAAKAAALKGIDLMNQCIERAAPLGALYQRLARLIRMANGGEPDQATIDAYTKMIEVLDSDPANLTKSSTLNQYRDAYVYMHKYYSALGDKEKDQEAIAQFDKYTELLNSLGQ